MFKDEFAAMIPAVTEWALNVKPDPWRHPLPEIEQALEEKARGRVLEIGEDPPQQPGNVPDLDWAAFEGRLASDKLYYDYTILDE